MSFDKDISKFVNKTNKNMTNVFRRSALIVFSSVIKRTPVKTGLARSNWQIGINIQPTGIQSIGPAIGTSFDRIDMANAGDKLYMVNNLPYIQALEHGHSKQAPAGMVKVSITNWNGIVATQALENRRR